MSDELVKYFKHSQSIVESEHIGKGTRIWAFAHILPGAKIGEDCNICDHVFIENDVVIGNRVTIKCGVQIWNCITIEDDVFVGPNVTFTNDLFPRSKRYPESWGKTVVQKGASIGANATILAGTRIGENAMVGAGSVITNNVPRNSIVKGNPARIQGYVDTPQVQIEKSPKIRDKEKTVQLRARDAKLYFMPLIEDIRGLLTFGEINQPLPFIPKRYFLVFDVPSKHIRGEHAHRKLHQFMVCVSGSCSVMLDDGDNRDEVILDSPTLGLYVPPLIWGVQYKYTPDAIMLVLASDIYNPDDYIRDYEDFIKIIKKC